MVSDQYVSLFSNCCWSICRGYKPYVANSVSSCPSANLFFVCVSSQIYSPFLPRKRGWPGPDEQFLHWPWHSHQLQHLFLWLLWLRCQHWQALWEEPLCRHRRCLACSAHTVKYDIIGLHVCFRRSLIIPFHVLPRQDALCILKRTKSC